MALYNRYKNEHYSERGIFWKLEILDTTLSSGNMNTEFDIAPQGVKVKWNGESDERYQPIKASSINFTMMVTNATLNGFVALLRAADEGRFTIKLSYYDGSSWNIYWRGFIVAENLAEEDIDYPYELDIEAIDGVGRLKDLDFNHSVTYNAGTGYRALTYIKDMLSLCGYIADFGTGNTFLTTVVDLYENSMSNIGVQSSDPVYKTQIHADAFLQIDDNGVENPVSALAVLENICKVFGARIFQSGGTWHFIQIQRYHTAGNVEYRRYDEANNALGNGTLDLNKVGGTGNQLDLDSTTLVKLAGMKKEFYEPLYRVAIQYSTFGERSLLNATPSNQYSGGSASTHALGGLTSVSNDSIELAWLVQNNVSSFNSSVVLGGYSGASWIQQFIGVQLYNDHSTPDYWDNVAGAWATTAVTNYFVVQTCNMPAYNAPSGYSHPYQAQINMTTGPLPRTANYSIKFTADPWVIDLNGVGAPNGTGQVSASGTGAVSAQAPNSITEFLSPSRAYGRYVLYNVAGNITSQQDYFAEVSNAASVALQDEALIGDGPNNASPGRLEVWNGSAWVIADTWQQSGAGTSATLWTVIAEMQLGGQRTFIDKNQMTVYLKGGHAYLPNFTNSFEVTEDSTDFLYIPNGIEIQTGLDEVSGEWFKSVLDTSSTTNTNDTHNVNTMTARPNRAATLR